MDEFTSKVVGEDRACDKSYERIFILRNKQKS